VMDPEKRVQKVLEAFEQETGEPVEVVTFVRMALGEGVEKREGDFAAEVAELGG